jgi:hypothetical protein
MGSSQDSRDQLAVSFENYSKSHAKLIEPIRDLILEGDLQMAALVFERATMSMARMSVLMRAQADREAGRVNG